MHDAVGQSPAICRGARVRIVVPVPARRQQKRRNWLDRPILTHLSGPMRLHVDELPIDSALARALVDAECPDFAELPLRRLEASGSSNVLFRLGDEHLVRLPRQRGGSASIMKEAKWLPLIAEGLPVLTPAVERVGRPRFDYPEHWSVVQWIDGDAPAIPPMSTGAAGELAGDLAALLVALRRLPYPPGAPTDPALSSYRGGPLSAIDASTRRYLDQCRGLAGLELDLDACLRVWNAAMELPAAPRTAPVGWLHGDLLAENLLLRDGRLRAVLDFGGLAVGDQTVDLVVGWELLDAGGRATLRSLLQVDDETWLRGRAWALAIALMTFPYYWHTMPRRCAHRRDMALAVLADDSAAR